MVRDAFGEDDEASGSPKPKPTKRIKRTRMNSDGEEEEEEVEVIFKKTIISLNCQNKKRCSKIKPTKMLL